MKTATILLLGLAVVCASCGGDHAGAGSVSPGVVDKQSVIFTVKAARQLDGKLATGTPDDILNQVLGDVFASASGIVLGVSPAQLATESPRSDGLAAAPAGTASCDVNGCTFMQFLHTLPNADTDVVDGTIAAVPGAAGERVFSVDLTLQGWGGYTATWTQSATVLVGSLHRVYDVSGLDDDFVRFDAVTFTDDEPTGGSVYAKSITDSFGGFDGTVTFP